jgi:thiol-disulfide isomerase/thioredoxin
MSNMLQVIAKNGSNRVAIGLLLGPLLFCLAVFAQAAPTAPEEWWVARTATGEPRIQLHFFWTQTCPHCRKARPFIEALPADYPWLDLHSYNLSRDMAGGLQYSRMAEALGDLAQAVPAFLFCGKILTGFDPGATDRLLRQELEECHRRYLQPGALAETLEIPTTGITTADKPSLDLPLIGALDPAAWSLPALTVVLAGLDAFNPCAFFVLLFLLSLLVHARNRRRMFLIGGVFIFFSGVIYFMFMAAWLNVFLWLGELQWITLLAGLLAVVMGGLNIKDFLAFQHGPSLSISDQAKPKLFKRMRGLVGSDRLPGLLLGTVMLAIVANSYELLCTAGFPMVYTRTLTLNDLSTSAYYLYLALYNLIYILPLLAIVLAFTWTLGSRKLQEREGRLLKLLSGTMMTGLGLMLLIYPQGLSEPGISLLVIIAALAITGLAAVRRKQPREMS